MRVLFHPVKGVGILQNCILFNPIIHNRKTASHSCGLSWQSSWILRSASWACTGAWVCTTLRPGGVLSPVHACSRWEISLAGLKRGNPRIRVQSRLLQFKYPSVKSTTILMRFSQVYNSSIVVQSRLSNKVTMQLNRSQRRLKCKSCH